MSIRSRIQLWGARIGEYYEGLLYEQTGFPLFWILKKILGRVSIAEESVTALQSLSEKGVIVYALKNKSQLNCLIIRDLAKKKGIERPVYCHGINVMLWQPFVKALKVIISRFFHNPYKSSYLKRITTDTASSIIYLRGSSYIGTRGIQDPLLQLIDAQNEMDIPIFLIPQLVAYGRRREKKDKSFWELIFGEVENPGMLRRVITFLRFSKKAFVISCEPVNLARFLEENSDKSLGTIAYLLRRDLIERINTEKRSIVGPLLKSREEIVGMVLRDAELIQFMNDMAVHDKREYGDIVREANKYLYEIAADYRDSYIGILDKLLTWVWNNIYDGIVIDKEGLAKIRTISKKMPFVVIPCHRSHIDYLLIHYIFYYNHIQLPFIAAGTNLMIWPLGHIFRRAGAFFLRRSFAGNALYATVFGKYIEALLREGLPIEFFIEGGRSRTGKMVMPRYGLLSMMIQAYRGGACNDLAIIPVYIGYDRVIEEKSYLKELGGEKKQQEKTTSLVKTGSVLKKRYGRVYLNIGDPISVDAYIASCGTPIEDRTTLERQSLYRKMGYEIARRINDVSVVTPFALVAAGLLAHHKRGISHDDLMSILDQMYDYLSFKKVRFSSTLTYTQKAVNDALSLFETSGHISKMGVDDDEVDEFSEIVYSVDEDRRLNLEYYKNTILHFFIPISFVATSILSSDEDTIPLSRIIDDYRFFKMLFWNEFIFDDEVDDVDEIQDALAYIRDRGMVADHEVQKNPRLEITGRGRVNLVPFAGLIQNYIESYWIAVRGSSYLKNKSRTERDLIRKVQKLGVRMYKKGEISKAEALSQPNYRGAIRYLQDVGIVDQTVSNDNTEKKKEVKLLSLTEDKNQIELLRHNLFKFVAMR